MGRFVFLVSIGFAFVALFAVFVTAFVSTAFAGLATAALRAFLAVVAFGRSRLSAPRDATFLRILSALLSICHM